MSDQRITDEELSDIERETKALFAFGDTDYHIEHNFLRLLAELHRTRAELAAVRKALFEDAHSSHDHRYRAIARALGDLDAATNGQQSCGDASIWSCALGNHCVCKKTKHGGRHECACGSWWFRDK